MWDNPARNAAVSTFFSLRSWFPVLSTEDFCDDLASTSFENSYKQNSFCGNKQLLYFSIKSQKTKNILISL